MTQRIWLEPDNPLIEEEEEEEEGGGEGPNL